MTSTREKLESSVESAEALAWAEFQRYASIGRKYLDGLERPFAAELARCLDPHVHERRVRSYGAIVARELPHLTHLGRLADTGEMSPELLRSCADGRKAMALVVGDEPPRLLVLHAAIETDQDYAARAAWVEGLIVANDDAGVVRIVTDASVTLVEGRRWLSKDLVFEVAEEVSGVVPAADPAIVRRLLELCHLRASPFKIGATLLYLLREEADGASRGALHRTPGLELRSLGVSVGRESDTALIVHQLKQRDGATVFGLDGRLSRVSVILEPTLASIRAVTEYAGTRHLSAARHTYDRPDVLAFVISADGPVTVFSDGRKISELKMRDSLLPKHEANAAERTVETECAGCGVSLAIRVVEVPGPMDEHGVRCPACGRVAARVTARVAEAFTRKTPQSIQALLALRQATDRGAVIEEAEP